MVMRLTSCLQVMTTLTKPSARLALHLNVGQVFLGLFQVVLHGLGLLHQAGEFVLC